MASEPQKPQLDRVENAELPEKQHVTEPSAATPEEEAAVIRKLDVRILPIVFTIYMLSVLDRSNLGNAHVAGLDKSIGLQGGDYAMLGTVFYIGCELPHLSAFTHLRISSLTIPRHRVPMDRRRLEAVPRAHLVFHRRPGLVHHQHPPSLSC
jgi:hypothetical protein